VSEVGYGVAAAARVGRRALRCADMRVLRLGSLCLSLSPRPAPDNAGASARRVQEVLLCITVAAAI
jgi:hypothetical protein